ncbi:MAG: hypothetical protein ABI574_04080, partial [Burkholderiales bacterium]
METFRIGDRPLNGAYSVLEAAGVAGIGCATAGRCGRRVQTANLLALLLLVVSLVGCETESNPARSQALATSKLCRLLQHGKVFTGQPEHASAESIVVCDEKIVAVDTDAELGYLASQIETIDLGGGTIDGSDVAVG